MEEVGHRLRESAAPVIRTVEQDEPEGTGHGPGPSPVPFGSKMDDLLSPADER